MYWHHLTERDRLDLAHHVYLAALSVTETDGAKIVCREALERAGARAGDAERLAQTTHERYLQASAEVDAGNRG